MSISAISLSGGNPWSFYGSGAAVKAQGAFDASTCETASDEQSQPRSISQRKELLDQLRQLREEKQQEKTNPFAVTTEDMVSSLFGETKAEDKEEPKENTSVNYNFRSVTSKIQQAKTSASAGQAVLSAKRKIQELKRKLANSDADPDEITFALNHAKRIERVARKKQHHLEMEEQIIRTQKRDERLDKTAEAAETIVMSQRDQLEDKLTDKQNAFDEKQTVMFVQAMEKLKESQSEITDDMIASVDEMIESLTEKEQEMLSEMAETLEDMEILDPHMSEEDLKELRTKHRNAENKEIVKADADYWKSMMKHNAEKAAAVSMNGSSSGFTMPSFFVGIGIAGASPSAADLVMSSFDAQV
ncbi:MAG: hypothetical protein K6B72_11855 [Lachnospiraceae bacterium]|nr:hypothetical protein [Lachnospiraceae bacterium]